LEPLKEAKGNTVISLSKDPGVTYKTARVFQQKCREAITKEAKEIRLEGEVEIDGGWFGGYIKPENVKINRVDRRLAEKRNG
jgi:hypothetical protein